MKDRQKANSLFRVCVNLYWLIAANACQNVHGDHFRHALGEAAPAAILVLGPTTYTPRRALLEGKAALHTRDLEPGRGRRATS
jgi:hypothetical protein